jgi:hypothetical protein
MRQPPACARRAERANAFSPSARLIGVVVLAMALIALPTVAQAALPSPPYTTADCAACHGAGADPWGAYSTADFSVGTIDRTTACRKCHYAEGWGPTTAQGNPNGPYDVWSRSTYAARFPHHSYLYTCDQCHDFGYGKQFIKAWPRNQFPAGWFTLDPSTVASAGLHTLHKRSRWPANIRNHPYTGATAVDCVSCHGEADCSACHDNLDVSHARHSYNSATGTYGITPYVGLVGSGTPDYQIPPDLAPKEVACSATQCHDRAAEPPLIAIEDNDPRMTYSGTWGTYSGSGAYSRNYENGQTRYTVQPQASVTATFFGTQVSVRWETASTNGIAKIYVDGALAATVDQYDRNYTLPRSWLPQWTSVKLPLGEHEIRIEHSGTWNPLSYNNGLLGGRPIYVDEIFYSSAVDKSFVPSCADCHAAKSQFHGYDAGMHAATDFAASGNLRCTQCHSMDLATEHRKPSATSAPMGCRACHGAGRPAEVLIGSWDLSCDACHAPVERHVCTDCHRVGGVATSTVDFTAATPVARASVCKKCHWEPSGAHPFHNPTWNCVSCHPEMGATNFAAVPKYYSVAYDAYFNSAASAAADTETLHAIHANPRWPAGVVKKERQCGSCHAAASCLACHEGAIDATHEDHTWDAGLRAYWPGTGPAAIRFGSGTGRGNERQNTIVPALSCSNATCHDITSGASQPVLVEDTNAGITYSVTPGWSRSGTVGYSGNSYRISNAAGARADYRFTGQKVELVSDVGTYRGTARISIDSVEVTTVDLYAASVQKQVAVFSSGKLASGEHTVTVQVTGLKNPASRAAYVVLDAFQVYAKVGTTRAACSACHAPDTFRGTPIDRRSAH